MALNFATTARYALRYMLGSTTIRDIDSGTQAMMQDVDDALHAEFFPGMIIWTARTTPSPNTARWLLCDGSSLLRTGYAELFSVIGTTYGAVDGTHFSLPDLRGRVAVMVDGSAGRLTVSADTLGSTGGLERQPAPTGHANEAGVIAGQTNHDPIETGDLLNVMQPYLMLNALIHI